MVRLFLFTFCSKFGNQADVPLCVALHGQMCVVAEVAAQLAGDESVACSCLTIGNFLLICFLNNHMWSCSDEGDKPSWYDGSCTWLLL